jgi:glycosyltransferase involved in cell wall biosynthesis
MNEISKSRICIHTTALNNGGTEREAMLLASQFTKWGIPTLLLVDRPIKNNTEIAKMSAVQVVSLEVSGSEPKAIYQQKLREALRRDGATLIHSHIWERRDETLEVAKQLGLSSIVTLHHSVRGTIFHRFGISRTPVLNWRHRRTLSRHNPVVVTLTEKSQRNFEYVYRGVRCSRFVYPGVNVSPLQASPGSRGSAANVIWVGAMIPLKRPHLALSIWSDIIRQYPNARLQMIGGGPLLEEVKARARTIGCSVEVLGPRCPWSDVASNAQLFFHTSSREGLPFVILEAMSMGLPVVATSSGDTSEAVSDGITGYLARPSDRKGLTRSLCGLIANAEIRAKFGQAGAKVVASRFSLERHCQEILAVYKDCAGLDTILSLFEHE